MRVEPFGANPKGQLVLTPQGEWIIIQTRADRAAAKTVEETSILFDDVIDENRMTIDLAKSTQVEIGRR